MYNGYELFFFLYKVDVYSCGCTFMEFPMSSVVCAAFLANGYVPFAL